MAKEHRIGNNEISNREQGRTVKLRSTSLIRSFFLRIGKYAQNLANHLRNSNKLPEPEEVSSRDKLLQEQEEEKLYILELPDEFELRKKRICKGMYERGKMEGNSGYHTSIPNIRKYAEAIIKDVQNDLTTKAVRKLRMAEKNLENHELKEANLSKVQKRVLEYHFDLIQYSQLNAKDYSRVLAFIYLFVAFALVIADIPLALELTKDGFGLQVTDIDELQIKNLFVPGRFWAVVRGNWEVVVMTAGVALCTIYIKIYWDEFVGSPVQNIVRQYKELPGNIDPAKELPKVKAYNKNRIIAKTGVLVLTLLTIVWLGVFRVSTRSNQIEIVNSLIEQSRNPNMVLQEQWTFSAALAFIFLTLLFPVVGGICLSKGLHNLHNRRELSRAEKTAHKFQKVYERFLEQEYAQAVAHKEDCAAYYKECSGEGFVEGLVPVLIEKYEKGYIEGLNSEMEMAQNDPFKQAELLRSKITKQKIQIALKPQ